MLVRIKETDFNFVCQQNLIRGKVRDNYFGGLNDFPYLVSIPTGRTSVYNVSLDCLVPHQGPILTRMSELIFKLIKDKGIIDNWVMGCPHKSLMVGKKLEIIPYEFVFRYYLTGSFWRDFYSKKNENPWGIVIKDGLQKNTQFSSYIFTPTRKSDGDPPISEDEIVQEGILNSSQLGYIKDIGYEIFNLIQEVASQVGLILVDFKLEAGFDEKGRIILADEPPTIHSARFWDMENYFQHMNNPSNVALKQISKQYFRDLLVDKGFDPEQKVSDMNPVPDITSEEEIQGFQIYQGLMDKFESVIQLPSAGKKLIIPSNLTTEAYLEDMYTKANDFLMQIGS